MRKREREGVSLYIKCKFRKVEDQIIISITNLAINFQLPIYIRTCANSAPVILSYLSISVTWSHFSATVATFQVEFLTCFLLLNTNGTRGIKCLIYNFMPWTCTGRKRTKNCVFLIHNPPPYSVDCLQISRYASSQQISQHDELCILCFVLSSHHVLLFIFSCALLMF